MTGNITLLIIVGVVMFAVLGGVTLIAHIYSLNGIKSRTVGDGQHGTARWANRSEIRKTYKHVPFTPEQWREQAKESKPPVTPDGQPLPQGIVVGCTGNTTAMVDTGDVHALMIGAAGVGKTAYWLYPCIEYACASGMSFLSTDTKGDIMRNYGQIAKDYGYHISVYSVPDQGNRRVEYAEKKEIMDKIVEKYRPDLLHPPMPSDDDGGAYGGQRQVMADPEAQGGGRAPGRERARDGGVSVQTSPRNRRMPEPPVTGKTAEVKSDGQA